LQELINSIHERILITSVGQFLDIKSEKTKGKVVFEKLNREFLMNIHRLKTGYGFVHFFKIAMLMVCIYLSIPCPRLEVEWIGRISWLPRAHLGPIFMTSLPER